MASNTSRGVSAAKGWRPAHSSYSKAPSEYTSEAVVASSPRNSSGGMYDNVPESVPDIVPDAPAEFASRRTGPASRASPKVQNLQHAVFAEDDVLRLNIAMEYPSCMSSRHSASRLPTQIDGLQVINRPGVDQLTKREAVDPFHRDEQSRS